MIRLDEIAIKLNEVLNNVNNPVRIDNARVAFMVATEGFRIDNIADKELGKNLIPVFIAASGGENNPVEGLKQQTKSINIGIWYPLKYKDNFYVLEDYLDDIFVGKRNNLGTSTGSCLTNLGTAEFGEITDGNFTQFEKWITSKYKKTLDVTMAWFSMTLTLYATKVADGFIFGNEIKYELEMFYYAPSISSVKYDDTTYVRSSQEDQNVNGVIYYCWKANLGGGNYDYIYTLKNPYTIENIIEYISLKNVIDVYKYVDTEFVLQSGKIEYANYTKTSSSNHEKEIIVRTDAGTGAQISPIAEQRIGTDNFATNVANITNYNKSIVVYPNLNQTLWKLILLFYNIQDLSFIKHCNLIKKYSNGYEYNFKQIVLGYNENSELGSSLSFTLTFGDAK